MDDTRGLAHLHPDDRPEPADPDAYAHDEPHDLGLSHDLPTLLSRRRALTLLTGAGVAATLAACGTASSPAAAGSAGSTSPTSTTAGSATAAATASATATATTAAVTEEIPEETAGPFPGDGSNGVNVLTESGIVRSDLRQSFGTGSSVAAGVPLTIKLTVLDVSAGAAPLVGAAVYLWHCDREGRYSMYDNDLKQENYLRGVQQTAADGSVTFTTIFPAAYSGRWPHAHFEVYPSLTAATSASSKLRTSQLALPADVCATVYATSGYEASVRNLARTSLSTDMVFRDGYSLQLAKMSGSVADGYTATLDVPV